MKPPRRQLPADFDQLALTPERFHTFYTLFMGLRFPVDVSELLDLRALINHAVDEFAEPPLTPDYRHFRESLEKALDSIHIDTPNHRQRMLKTLALMRDLHVAHAQLSRMAEERLRFATQENRLARKRTVHVGIGYLLACIASLVGWVLLTDTLWLAKLLSLFCAWRCWKQFHTLPRLDHDANALRAQLNDVLRQRVPAINWKTFIHKLAFTLGIKKRRGVEVFRSDSPDPRH